MIDRYSRPKMTEIWSLKNKFQKMLEVEVAVAKVQARLKMIPRKAALEIEKKSKFNVDRILEIEKTTKHDVIAFVSNLAENVGENGRFIHYGLTSSDVLDTAQSLLFRDAFIQLGKEIEKLDRIFLKLIKKHSQSLCAGRTHGMHAEPTSFGYKLAGFHAEFRRNILRLQKAYTQSQICKLSGAVGTYSTLSIELEQKLAFQLKLKPESIATQVIPRDRHSEVLFALASYATGIERLAIELRHLQRTEVGEVVENFTPGQKGSSAMPHKKNPITAENLCGCARLMRSYIQIGLDNVLLWHERDISHSSAERIIFPDAFILADYMTAKMTDLLTGLYVNEKRMLENLMESQGTIFSSHVLLALVETGMSREDAYKVVQSLSHSMEPKDHLKSIIKKQSDIYNLIGSKKLEQIFSGKTHQQAIRIAMKNYKLLPCSFPLFLPS